VGKGLDKALKWVAGTLLEWSG